jgi:hypothetical protein
MFRKISRSLSRRGADGDKSSDEEFVSQDARRLERAAVHNPNHALSLEEYNTLARAPRFDRIERPSDLQPIAKPQRAYIASAGERTEIHLPPSVYHPTHARTQSVLESPAVARRVRDAIEHDRLEQNAALDQGAGKKKVERFDPNELLDQLSPLPLRIAKPRRPQLVRNAVSENDTRSETLRVQAIRRSHQELLARELSARPLLRNMPRRASEPELRFNVPPVETQSPLPQREQQERRGRRRAESSTSQNRELRPSLPNASGQYSDYSSDASSRSRSRHTPTARPQNRGVSAPGFERCYSQQAPQMMQPPSTRDFYLEMAAQDYWSINANARNI